MIPQHLVSAINEIRSDVLAGLTELGQAKSFQALRKTSPPLEDRWGAIHDVLKAPVLRRPCDGKITCAIVGSSGHGKTTVLDEMFPTLSKRGWLVTDVTDTTSQSLRIEYEGSERAQPGVQVHSWNLDQIKALMASPEVQDSNARDNIRVAYREDGIEVDGSEATFKAEDQNQFRFPRRMDLRPFGKPYAVPKDKEKDSKFIRALTIKEPSQALDPGPVLDVEGEPYDSLQLRALVKDVTLKDPYERIAEWGGDHAKNLTFVDTPGLAVSGSIKDEVLRHFLEKKSHQIVLQLWKDDELDIIVHLVLCGRQSDFSALWKFIERECGPSAMDSLGERLILAINGMNIYFTNRDLRKRFVEKEVAVREGDHLSTTLEDNILQKMSPHGRVQPARVCFLDSKGIVETLTGDYERAYGDYRDFMEEWIQPSGVGYETLSRLGLSRSFRENMEALCDPTDRGQGYLVRQISDLVQEKGPLLLIKKHLQRTNLLSSTESMLQTLLRYYDTDGQLNREGVQEALKSCLAFLDSEDLSTIESFVHPELDTVIDQLIPEGSKANGRPPTERWVSEAFYAMSNALKERIVQRATESGASSADFVDYFDDLTEGWAERWGYHLAQLTPPGQGYANTGDLVRHCLKIHCREILYQLIAEESGPSSQKSTQDQKDRERIKNAIALLDNARRLGMSICADYGVEA